MIRLSPRAAARWSTSRVAIIVTAIPFTTVVESPALNVSTVTAGRLAFACSAIRATISAAVCARAGSAATKHSATMATDLTPGLMTREDCAVRHTRHFAKTRDLNLRNAQWLESLVK